MLPKSTGTSAMGSAGSSSRSRNRKSEPLPEYPFYALCVENDDYEIVLKLGKPYKVIKPRKHDPDYFFRVIDEEGEDYLYPRDWFVPLDLPPKHRRQVAAALATAKDCAARPATTARGKDGPP